MVDDDREPDDDPAELGGEPRNAESEPPAAAAEIEDADSEAADNEDNDSDGADGEEISLDSLTQAFAQLVDDGGDSPAVGEVDEPQPTNENPEPADSSVAATRPSSQKSKPAKATPHAEAALPGAVEDSCPISPRTILESILFVGHPENEPLTSRQIAALLRGVSPREVDELVQELNELYDQLGYPYQIASPGAGYRMQLREEFNRLRENFYGKIRSSRLSQAAIDILAIVAYNQPIDRKQIDKLRGRPSGAVLTQLVRRQILKVEKVKPRSLVYRTTDRFLALFGLESVDQLPQSADVELPIE